MRIGIDVRCLAEGRRTGVEEYTLNLLNSLFEMDQSNDYILFFNSFKSAKIDFSWIEKYPNVILRKFNYPNKLLNFLFWYLDWPKIDKMIGGADIFFMPNIIFGSISKNTRLILTIHDLSFERYSKTFSWKRRLWHAFINPKKICQKADKIIAVSESTKNDIVKLYKINQDKINVSYSGVSEKFKALDRNNGDLIRVKEKYGLPYKFILYLGTIEPRKNISAIIAAYNRLQGDAVDSDNSEIQRYKLVIAGSEGWLGKKIFTEISESNRKENILVVNFIDETDKEFVLNLASLFVYPSIFEGFGFPPLEAMACGVPVIASNNSSLPEVVGNGAVMIDPDKPDEIYRALKEILASIELRESLIKKSLEKAGKFNWQKSAEEFLNLANKI